MINLFGKRKPLYDEKQMDEFFSRLEKDEKAKEVLIPKLKASELRVGNYLKRKPINISGGRLYNITTPQKILGVVEGNKEKVVTEISEDETLYLEDLNRFEPIPLAPKILELLDFKHTVFDEYRNVLFAYRVGGLLIRIYDRAIITLNLDHLHQYQNIYYSLTGYELHLDLTDLRLD